MQETILKGGSLNKTSILTFEDGRQLVRKSISRKENREYGFVRWYSQMKRLQHYETLFPGLFPKLLAIGVEGDAAFFDIEYFPHAIDVKTWLTRDNPSQEEIQEMHEQLWQAMDAMHSSTLLATPNALQLYYHEEVDQKLSDACQTLDFRHFTEQSTLEYDGVTCDSLIHHMPWYKDQFLHHNVEQECFTHGNITLENILYDTKTKRIIFIDPYDENVLDCIENEYSQILQCSKNYYGFLNDREVFVTKNRAYHNHTIPEPLKQFDTLFRARMKPLLRPESRQLVALFEISQFVRMLPFKVATGNVLHAKYFYTLASQLLHQLHQESG